MPDFSITKCIKLMSGTSTLGDLQVYSKFGTVQPNSIDYVANQCLVSLIDKPVTSDDDSEYQIVATFDSSMNPAENSQVIVTFVENSNSGFISMFVDKPAFYTIENQTVNLSVVLLDIVSQLTAVCNIINGTTPGSTPLVNISTGQINPTIIPLIEVITSELDTINSQINSLLTPQ